MYRNSKFDEYCKVWREKKQLNLPYVALQVLRVYSGQVIDTEINPFNILVLNDIDLSSIEVAETFLDFIYSSGVKQVIWADESTASLQSLSLMMSIRKYRINVLDGLVWKSRFNTDKYGIVLEVVKRRKS